MNPLLRMAVVAGVETAVRIHIRRGDDLDARDCGGATPLMLAAGRRKKEVVALLLAAGADPALMDPSGLNAMDHAERSGAAECADLIRTALVSTLGDCSPAEVEGETVVSARRDDRSAEITDVSLRGVGAVGDTATVAVDEYSASVSSVREAASFSDGANGEEVEPPDATKSPKQAVSDTCTDPELGRSGGGPDLTCLDAPDDEPGIGGWEPEEESVAPEGNATVVDEVRAIHEAIGQHQAIDSDEDWGDIEAFLPERALPLAREDGEGGGVRSLLLRALREGSVPESAIVEVCREADGSQNEETERLLSLVLGDLGALIDERDESGGAPHEPGETFEEEPVLSEAMAYAEELASGRNEPLRLYLRGFKGELLKAEEEFALGRAMEEAGEAALDALAAWPAGVAAVAEAGRRVACGEADVESFSSGPEPSSDGDPTTQAPESDSEEDVAELNRDASAFVAAVGEVETSAGQEGRLRALVAANLSRGFLLELAKAAGGHGVGSDFAAAMMRQVAAREKMILSNLRLAFSLAKKYMRSGEPLEDLVQEANIGLMKAVERYDWRKGFRFSTYATWWIRQQISRAIADKSRTIRIPVHMHETVRRTVRERDEFEARTGRPEKLEETALRMGLAAWKAQRILEVSEGTASLDELDAETGLPFGEGLPGPESEDPCLHAEAASLRSTLLGMIGELKEREGEVIVLRFGLGEEDPMTLEEVGQRFGVTRERIRQIEAKALRRLSHLARKTALAVYLYEGRWTGSALARATGGRVPANAMFGSEAEDGT